jgi:hypothetical protein
MTNDLVHDPSSNRPPADAELTDLRERLARDYDGLIKKFYEIEIGVGKVPEQISDDATAGRVTEFIAQAQGIMATAKRYHDQEKKPWLDRGRLIDRFFNDRIDKLTLAVSPILRRLGQYRRAKETRERLREAAERAAAYNERNRAMAEAEAQAKEADRLAALDDRAAAATAFEAAAAALEEAHRANETLGRPPERVRIHGDYGSTAFSRVHWTFEITDAAAVPRQYLAPDARLIQTAIDRAVKLAEAQSKDEPEITIEGVRIYRDDKLSIRRGGVR